MRAIVRLAERSIPDLIYAALAWAQADRSADDRAADITELERVIAASERPIPSDLLAARERALTALREACKVERSAEREMREAANRLLDAHPSKGST